MSVTGPTSPLQQSLTPSGPTHGHYVTVVKSEDGSWVMCDDENIEPISEDDLANYFGDSITGAGYVLFYQAADLDLRSLGLKKIPEPKIRPEMPKELVKEAKKVLEPQSTPADSPAMAAAPIVPAAAAVPVAVTPPVSSPKKSPVPMPSAPMPAAPVSPAAAASSLPAASNPSNPSTPSLPSSSGTPNGSMRKDSTTASTLLSSAFMDNHPRREASTIRREPSTTQRSSSGDKSARWSILKRKDEARSPLQRQGTATTLGTVGTDSTGSTHHEPAEHHAHHGAADLSSSVMSSLSATSGGATSSGRSPSPPSVSSSNRLGRSASAARPDRTPSGMSTNGGGYGGGASLGRKLSDRTGLGKLARTTSSGWKMGFGKKGKVDEEGN